MSENENSARPRSDFIYTKNSARPTSDCIYTKIAARPGSDCIYTKIAVRPGSEFIYTKMSAWPGSNFLYTHFFGAFVRFCKLLNPSIPKAQFRIYIHQIFSHAFSLKKKAIFFKIAPHGPAARNSLCR